MAKTVFKPSELIHTWAHGGTINGRTPTRNHREDWNDVNPRKVVTLFVKNTVLYSYGEHYPLANRIEVPEYSFETLHYYRTDKPEMEAHEYHGSVVYLINEEKSTVTTEAYKNEVMRGIPSYLKYFVVPFVNQDGDGHDWHDENIKWYADKCKELWQAPPRERKGLVANRIRQYIKVASDMQAYCLVFKGEHWVNEKVDTMLIPVAIRHARKVLEVALSAEREYQTKQAEARNKRYAMSWEERKELKRSNEAARINKKVAKFRNGINVESFTGTDGCALLRVTSAGNVVTSQGASFPAIHAAKALRMLRLMLTARIPVKTYERAEEPGAPFEVYYERDEHSIHLGHYSIDKVTNEAQASDGEWRSWQRYTVSDSDAMIYAGCHRVKWSEVLLNEAAIMEAAKQLEV
jgi:hypothetical protein